MIMELKFTFEDGSESLMHYGKVGMRWRKGRKSDWENKNVVTTVPRNPSERKTASGASSKTSGKGKSYSTLDKAANVKRKSLVKQRVSKLKGTAGLTKGYAKKVDDINRRYESIIARRKQQKLYGQKIT